MGSHKYTLEEYGLFKQEIDKKFSKYMSAYCEN